MTAIKITKRFVDSLKPTDKAASYYDSELKGFGVRVMPSGVASYIIEYRPDGGGRNVSKKRMAIGRVGEITPEQARKMAQARLSEVRQGNDPLADRQTKRKEISVKELIDQWEEEKPASKRTGKPMADLTRTYTLARLRHHVVPILGSKRVSEVNVDDINSLIRRISKGETRKDGPSLNKHGRIRVRGGEGAARKVAASLSVVFGFAVEKKIVVSNPVSAAHKPRPGKRHDFLREEEMASIASALSAMEQEGANEAGIAIIRLLLVTGARPSEIEGLKWSEVDFQNRCLRLEKTKTGHSLRPIPAIAVQILEKIKRQGNSPFVFPATRGDGHFTASKKTWNSARERAGLPERVRYHARHAVASMALSEGHDIASVAAIMGHAGPRTTLAVYAHVLDRKAINASDDIGSRIGAAMEGKATSDEGREEIVGPYVG